MPWTANTIPSCLIIRKTPNSYPFSFMGFWPSCTMEDILHSSTLLMNWVKQPFVKSPKNIVLYGLEATGKTSVTASLLSALRSSNDSVVDENGHDKDTHGRLQYAVVKSAECITGRHLLETVISATADAVGWEGSVNRCENLAQLAVGISRLLEGRIQSNPDGLSYPNGFKFVIVLDGIDRQRDAPPTLLPALARLAEMVSWRRLWLHSAIWP